MTKVVPIACPLKGGSTIAWGRCVRYRSEHGCLCGDALTRLHDQNQAPEAIKDWLWRIDQEIIPKVPEGYTLQSQTRLTMVMNDKGDTVIKVSSKRDARHYLALVAELEHCRRQAEKLRELLLIRWGGLIDEKG